MKAEPPFFSIIIPTYARPKQLASCLQALAQLDYPTERFEVIVVDDGSPEPMNEGLDPFRDAYDRALRLPWGIKLIRQPNAGPATARNTGAAHAKGEFLAFTDDDCAPDAGWLQALANRFSATPDKLLGGQTVNALSENLFATASQQLISYLYSYYNHAPNQARFLTSNNFALSAARFKELRGFDTTFPLAAGEDREFCDRWLHYGYQIGYVPEAIVYHRHALSLTGFWRQHFNYGRGAFHFHQVRAQRQQEAIKVEPLSFYLNLLRYPLTQTCPDPGRKRPLRAWLLMALMILSQVANTAGFFWQRIQRTLFRNEARAA